MPVAETWLLPDGVADVLPEQACGLEQLRRQLLDTLTGRGYELVYTPLVEYVESLLTADNSDLDLQTFKLIDQISGRLLGVPQHFADGGLVTAQRAPHSRAIQAPRGWSVRWMIRS